MELMGQLTMFGNDENYKVFTDKFVPAKTTDDCYTPENVYEAVAGWVAEEYGVDRETFMRPFYPGGDYEYANYPDGCVVVDNPPFSILQGIVNFYMARGIRFFLFAPGLTLLRRRYDVCCIASDSLITYENGADVKTGFVTNLEPEITPEGVRCGDTLLVFDADAVEVSTSFEYRVRLGKQVSPLYFVDLTVKAPQKQFTVTVEFR